MTTNSSATMVYFQRSALCIASFSSLPESTSFNGNVVKSANSSRVWYMCLLCTYHYVKWICVEVCVWRSMCVDFKNLFFCAALLLMRVLSHTCAGNINIYVLPSVITVVVFLIFPITIQQRHTLFIFVLI